MGQSAISQSHVPHHGRGHRADGGVKTVLPGEGRQQGEEPSEVACRKEHCSGMAQAAAHGR